ncbi:MAG: ATP synthase subunit I [Microthrixaceae bacterium]|nr:ATP synthase subunit I [Microthrixaceae bacterium]
MSAGTDADNALLVALEGPAPAMEIALDLVKRSGWALPVVLFGCAAFWGLDGALSGAYALGIVVVNFLLAAWLLQVTGRISFAAMAGAALFGYVLRLGLIFLAVMLVRDASWVSLVPLGLTLIATHLGLLFWELRYVSGSFAYPGLKPKGRATPSTPSIESAA